MNRNFLLTSLFAFSSITMHSQSLAEGEIYSWFDNIIGIENTSLFNGVEYVDNHRVINEKHKFYGTTEFQPGYIIYSGQPFYNVPLKYDIYDDLVIARLDHQFGSSFFQLLKSKISEFTLGEKKFKVLNNEGQPGSKSIYEVLDAGNHFSVYKKHRKKMFKRKNDKAAYYEFEKLEPEYVFQYLDQIYSFDKRKDLISVFPDLEDEIKKIYRSKRKRLKDTPDIFMQELSTELNILLSGQNKK